MYKLSKDIIIKKRDSIYFGLNMKDGTTYEMNESQYDIVIFFKDNAKTKDELLNHLLSIYDIKIEDIMEEIDFSLSRLVDLKILINE